MAELVEATAVGAPEITQRVRLRKKDNAGWIFEMSFRRGQGQSPEALLQIAGDGTLTSDNVVLPAKVFFPERLARVMLEARPTLQAMQEWHREQYLPQADPVKRAFAPVVSTLRARRHTEANRVRCRQLEGTLDRMLQDPAALRAPDTEAEEALRLVFERFRRLARSCASSGSFDSPLAESSLESTLYKTNVAVNRAAAILARYGLEP